MRLGVDHAERIILTMIDQYKPPAETVYATDDSRRRVISGACGPVKATEGFNCGDACVSAGRQLRILPRDALTAAGCGKRFTAFRASAEFASARTRTTLDRALRAAERS